jgi:ParB family transcriptional regulator, chromosome partitioning protein
MVTWNPWLDSEPSTSGRWRMVQRKLGRGLDFLISGSGEPSGDEVAQLELASIRPNPFQPRREFTEAELAELAASIREHGVLQPVVVRRQGDTYQLIAGERRLRACQQLALATIPALIRDADDTQMLELALIENIQRSDLNPMELARAYHSYIERLSLTQEQAATRLGKSRPAVANTLRLLDLPAELQDLVSRGTLSMGHARALLAVGNADLQRTLALRIVAEGWSVRDVEQAVQAPPAPPAVSDSSSAPESPTEADAVRSAHLRDLEAQLRERLGTRVRVQDRGGRGRIVIEYFTKDDFDRVLDLLVDGHPVT